MAAGARRAWCVCGHEADMHAPSGLGPTCHGCMWATPRSPFPIRHPVVPEPGPVTDRAEPLLGPLDMILHAIREEV